MPDWWKLPGPSSFVETAAEDLRRGRSVVLCLPECIPDGLKSALRAMLPPSDGWNWESIDTTGPAAARPLEYVISRYVADIPPDVRRDVWSLGEQPSFWGLLIWLDSMTEERWPAWRQFLSDYQEACRQRPRHERSVFCVSLVGRLALSPPQEEVCLSIRSWKGCVGSLDMLLYTSELYRNSRLPPVRRRVAVMIAASLALWDPVVSERLALEPIEALLDPRPILAEIARDRGWCSGNDEPLWHLGMVDSIDGKTQVHSAWLALSDTRHELTSRLWKAEVGTILPHLEEQRREVLARFSQFLKLPFTTCFGETITDPFELEISHIAAQLGRTRVRLEMDTKRRLVRMADVRNKLAHLKVLCSEDLDILD